MQTGRKVPEGIFGKTLDIIKNFADGRHHGKEDDYFP